LRDTSELQFPVGQEVAGIVISVGSEVKQVQAGDRIAAFLPLMGKYSGCATECVVDIYDTVKLPQSVSFEEAAAVLGDGIRAYTALYYQAHVTNGDTVLIMDGASSAGEVALQLATCWGAKILATHSTKEERFHLEDMGANRPETIELQEQNSTFINTVLEESGGMGVDILIDNGVRLFQLEEDIELMGERSSFAMPSKHEILSVLGMGSRWVTSHHALQLDPPDSRTLFLKAASVSFLFEHIWTLSGAQYGRFQHILRDLMAKLAGGVIKPNIQRRVSLQEAVTVLPSLHMQRIGKTVMVL